MPNAPMMSDWSKKAASLSALLICAYAATFVGCEFVDELIYGPNIYPDENGEAQSESEDAERVRSFGETSIPVPLAQTNLPEDHRITARDIALRKMTISEMHTTGWDITQLMMLSEQLEGRVIKYSMNAGEPFYSSSIYLEGTEPGAPPEPDTPDPPWPAPRQIELLINELPADSEQVASDAYEPVLMPIALADLPAGRRIRESDIVLRPVMPRPVQEMPFPSFELMLSPEQIVGRRLRKPLAQGEPLLLSDFHIDERIEQYLEDCQR